MQPSEQIRVSDILLAGHWYKIMQVDDAGTYRESGDGLFEAHLGEFPDRSGARLTPARVVGRMDQIQAWRFEADGTH